MTWKKKETESKRENTKGKAWLFFANSRFPDSEKYKSLSLK